MRLYKTISFPLIIILVCIILFFLNLGKRGLWSPDETRYVAVAKEILYSGDWVNLRRNSEIYAQKPPLFFWLMSISGILLGKLSEFAARLPSALSGLGAALMTYLFANALFSNKKIAFFSALILITSFAYMAASQWVILDPLLSLFVILSIFMLYLGLTRPRARLAAYLAAFFFIACGILTKGPVGLILPILVMASYAFLTKKSRNLWTLEFALGLAASILVVLTWLIPACVRGGHDYTNELLIKQIFGRFLNAFDHKEPFYFYFLRFPLEFLPWAVFLPSAIIFLVKNKMKEDGIKLIFAWFLSIFIFFTISKSKNDLYILPAYPAAAMAIAYYLENRIKSKARILIYIVAVVAVLNIILTYAVIPRFDKWKSPRYFAQKTAAHIKPSEEITTFRTNPVYWLYYCDRRYIKELGDFDALKSYLGSEKKVFCIIENADLENFVENYKTKVYVLEKAPYGHKKIFALITNGCK